MCDVLKEAVEDWSMVWRTQLKSPRRRGGIGRDRGVLRLENRASLASLSSVGAWMLMKERAPIEAI